MAEAQFSAITPEGWQRGLGFSHGYTVEGGQKVLFIAGQVATERGAGEGVVSDDFVEQWDQCLANVRAVVEAVGGRMENVTALRIFVTDINEYLENAPKLGGPQRRHFGKHFPASTLVGVTGLVAPGAKVEIEGTAVIG